MKSVNTLVRLKPVAALLAIGVLAFSLALEGSPAPTLIPAVHDTS